jgi:hypothetical protein
MMSNYRKTAVLLIAVCLPILAFASTTEQLQTAASGGAVAFVLVVEPGATGIDQARQTIESAMSQMPGSQMIESDRADAANSAFVQKYKLAAAPAPLILVFASNGIIAGGNVASSLNAEQLVAMVPSPKKAEVLMAIQSGQAAYVTASRTGMATASQVTDVCASACSQMKGKCVTINVSMDDPAEAAFLKQLKVNLQAKEPVTVVLNAQGQMTDTFNGPVEVASLVKAVAKKVSSACCPPGSGKKCPPTPAKKEGK